MGVHNLSDKSSFDTSVKGAEGVIVIDFFATWCGPCKAIAPAIAKMSEEGAYKEKVKFYKIDVDETPDVAQELGIRAMPTFAIFKDGEKIDEVVGANERALRQKIDAALSSKTTGQPYQAPPAQFNIMSYIPILVLAILAYRYYMGI